MADYHPLIARAVAGLEKNTGENRRALYERARTALVAQLRGVQPVLEESEITRERLALEEAIRKVEAEAARHARETARPNVIKSADAKRRDDAARAASTQPADGAAPRPSVATAPNAPVAATAPVPDPQSPSRSSQRWSLSDEALKGYRRVTGGPAQETPAPEAPPPAPKRRTPPEQLLPPAPSIPPPEPHPLHEYGQLEPQMQPENLWALPLDGTPAQQPVDFDAAAAHLGQPPVLHDEAQPEPAPPPQRRAYGRLIRNSVLAILILAVGALAYWQRQPIADLAGAIGALVRSPPAPTPREAAPRGQPKITDRIGQPGAQTPSVPVAQRVVLYEEDPQDAQGKRFSGTVLWRSEMKAAAPGRPPELAIRADIEVPERKMTVSWSLRRNTDQSLPASHTIEIMFNLPADAVSGGVQNVPGVLMKQAEQTRGIPLAGLAVKVTPGFFLIGLSALEADMQRNLQLLRERSWFDIPIVYNNNRRAILAMEKGTPGEKAFDDAFAAWRQ
jgi:hypothetical protein